MTPRAGLAPSPCDGCPTVEDCARARYDAAQAALVRALDADPPRSVRAEVQARDVAWATVERWRALGTWHGTQPPAVDALMAAAAVARVADALERAERERATSQGHCRLAADEVRRSAEGLATERAARERAETWKARVQALVVRISEPDEGCGCALCNLQRAVRSEEI